MQGRLQPRILNQPGDEGEGLLAPRRRELLQHADSFITVRGPLHVGEPAEHPDVTRPPAQVGQQALVS